MTLDKKLNFNFELPCSCGESVIINPEELMSVKNFKENFPEFKETSYEVVDAYRCSKCQNKLYLYQKVNDSEITFRIFDPFRDTWFFE